ncbi:Zn-ribbon domain-containing OB-fold protein [Roseomonas sp. BN140053]|uniref:Zn-ribbon domain-containing OB-fold protein n=1 Tax=Roseomonas sp. BN140053 TaxID=3391898 RepID=UPI0039E7F5D9
MAAPTDEKTAAIDPELAPYFEGAAAGVLRVKQCGACSRFFTYPRKFCPFCFSDDTHWRDASGRGTIYSCSVLRRTREPYCIAYVTLEEGPTMLSNIVDCDLDALRIGQPVRAVFRPAGDGKVVPFFTAAPGDAAPG